MGKNKRIRRQVDNKTTAHIRIDRGLIHLLKIQAAKSNTSIRKLVEAALTETYGLNNDGNFTRLKD